MSKNIAFFGDSFVGDYAGWIKEFCTENNYRCIHLGKPGSDNIYPFEKWKKFNETHNQHVDVCVYAHTECFRIYNRHSQVGINFLTAFDDVSSEWVSNGYVSKDYLNAVRDYFKFVLDTNDADMRSILIPLGIDRYMNEYNKVFEKIIHIWSFAPNRIYPENNNGSMTVACESTWHITNMLSGANIILDLSNLAAVDPDINIVNGRCQRPLHFSSTVSPFVSEIIKTAVLYYKKDLVIDFRPYVDQNSVYNDYLNALKKIKQGLEINEKV